MEGIPAICYDPGKQATQRNQKGVCAWGATTCCSCTHHEPCGVKSQYKEDTQLPTCPFCLVSYCDYHFPKHFRQEKWIRPYLLSLDSFAKNQYSTARRRR